MNSKKKSWKVSHSSAYSKSLLLVVCIILTTIVSIGLSSAPVSANTPLLQLTLLNQDPDPVGPGEYVTLRFRLDNIGQSSIDDIEITFNEAYPFSLDQGVSPIKRVTSLGSLQGGSLGVFFDFRVRVAADAVIGRNEFSISYTGKNQGRITQTFPVTIRAQDSGVIISSVVSEVMTPGIKNDVVVRVLNPSDSLLRDVSVRLDLTDPNLPFAPAYSATTKTLRFLPSDEIGQFTFTLLPFSDAAARVYRIPVEISYFDPTNQLIQKFDLIGLVVGGEVELDIYASSDSLFSNHERGGITLHFVNRGLIDVRFLDVELLDTQDYTVVSRSRQYIGTVNSDDFETEDFTLVKEAGVSEIDLQVRITYRDANNNPFQKEMSIPVTLFPSANGNSSFGIWIILLVAVVGFFIYRQRKKKHKRKD